MNDEFATSINVLELAIHKHNSGLGRRLNDKIL